MNYSSTILISKALAAHINSLCEMSGNEIYQKYGYHRDETITLTAKFDNGYEADIKTVICEEDSPYVDPVLFNPFGSEVCVLGVEDGPIQGEYVFENGADIYTVVVGVTNDDETSIS